MEEFTKKHKKEKLLKQLNTCRMSLQAITLSEITTSTGKKICPYAVKGVQHPHRQSTYKWLNQSKIGSKFWRIWETCVKDTFYHTQTRLKYPLKDWINGAEQSQQWQTFANHDIGNLIWIIGQGGMRQCRGHKIAPTKKYLVYNKGQGTLIQQPTTLYKISLLSQSPQTWVFQKSGSGLVTGTREAT